MVVVGGSIPYMCESPFLELFEYTIHTRASCHKKCGSKTDNAPGKLAVLTPAPPTFCHGGGGVGRQIILVQMHQMYECAPENPRNPSTNTHLNHSVDGWLGCGLIVIFSLSLFCLNATDGLFQRPPLAQYPAVVSVWMACFSWFCFAFHDGR